MRRFTIESTRARVFAKDAASDAVALSGRLLFGLARYQRVLAKR